VLKVVVEAVSSNNQDIMVRTFGTYVHTTQAERLATQRHHASGQTIRWPRHKKVG